MLKLLIVDDEESMLEGLRTMVNWEELGYELAAAFRDGRDAVAYLAENPVDVVLTDIRMPHKDGIDIAAYIHDNKLPTRVALMSGYQDFEAARQAMRYGVSHYITKPFMLKTIRETLGEIAGEVLRDRAAAEDTVKAQRHMEQMREFMRERFFVEAASGGLRHQYIFDRWVDILRIDATRLNARCALFSLRWLESMAELRRLMINHFPDEYACAFRSSDSGEVIILCLGDAPAADDFAFVDRMREALGSAPLSRIAVADSVRGLSLKSLPGSSLKEGPVEEAHLPEDSAASAACAYIQAHYGEKLSLNDVANYVHLNPAYLSRMFSEQTGYSFRDYLTNTRVQAAVRLLTNTRMPVYAVCEAVGYTDIKHFYKLFRQVMGVTPTEYREMAGEAYASRVRS